MEAAGYVRAGKSLVNGGSISGKAALEAGSKKGTRGPSLDRTVHEGVEEGSNF